MKRYHYSNLLFYSNICYSVPFYIIVFQSFCLSCQLKQTVININCHITFLSDYHFYSSQMFNKQNCLFGLSSKFCLYTDHKAALFNSYAFIRVFDHLLNTTKYFYFKIKFYNCESIFSKF